MPFELRFLPSAFKEWEKLGETIRQQLKRKLAERLRNPRIEADKLRTADLKDCYKIKLRSSGYRLVYRVDDMTVTVTVVTVGKRNRGAVYRAAKQQPSRPPSPPDSPGSGGASPPQPRAPRRRKKR